MEFRKVQPSKTSPALTKLSVRHSNNLLLLFHKRTPSLNSSLNSIFEEERERERIIPNSRHLPHVIAHGKWAGLIYCACARGGVSMKANKLTAMNTARDWHMQYNTMHTVQGLKRHTKQSITQCIITIIVYSVKLSNANILNAK